MRKLVLLLAVALLFPAAAHAKELKGAKVCGASGCANITKASWRDAPIGGDNSTDAPPPTPYYTVTFLIGEPGQPAENHFTMYYLPTRHVLAADGIVRGDLSWFPIVGARANDWVERATAGLTPFPTPKRWPHAIQSPRKLLPEAGSSAGSEATPIARTTAPVAAAVGNEGAWSNWFLAPILGIVAAVTAAAFAVLSRRTE
jgi:hypothetical protein